MQDTAGEVERSSLVVYSYGSLHMAEEKQVDNTAALWGYGVYPWRPTGNDER